MLKRSDGNGVGISGCGRKGTVWRDMKVELLNDGQWHSMLDMMKLTV